MDDSKLAEMKELHRDRNQQSADLYEDFSTHRQMISGIIQQCLNSLPLAREEALPTLTVWGAGNTNDLDLPAVCAHFSMIQLIDLDPVGLQRAAERQDLSDADRAKLRLIGNCDATGLLPELAALAASFHSQTSQSAETSQLAESPQSADPSGATNAAAAQTANFIAQAATARPQILSPEGQQESPSTEILKTDVVVSACLLSQLIDSVFKGLGDGFPYVNEAVLAVRDNHLSMLLDAVESGSIVALITDFVSSDTLPELNTEMPPQEFSELVVTALNGQNFFTGTNPAAIQQRWAALEQDRAGFAGAPGKLKIGVTQPWRWRFGKRSFATIALIGSR